MGHKNDDFAMDDKKPQDFTPFAIELLMIIISKIKASSTLHLGCLATSDKGEFVVHEQLLISQIDFETPSCKELDQPRLSSRQC